MAGSAWKGCFKFCGYFCGALAALNIWFFIGLTVFQSMKGGNPWIAEEMLALSITEFKSDDASKFVKVFAICIGLNVLCMIGCCGCTQSKCYKDKDVVVYHVPVSSRVADEFTGDIQSKRDSDVDGGQSALIGRY